MSRRSLSILAEQAPQIPSRFNTFMNGFYYFIKGPAPCSFLPYSSVLGSPRIRIRIRIRIGIRIQNGIGARAQAQRSSRSELLYLGS